MNGSPTVSPTTAALWASEPLPSPSISPFSIAFLALSQAPPALAISRASSTPVTVAPANMPPRAAAPSTRPTTTGAITAVRPGRIISLSAAAVEMSTQRAASGFAPSLPSSRPGISRNCRRISSTICPAARPTAVMVRAPIKKGRIPPSSRPITTTGSVTTMSSGSIPAASRFWSTAWVNAENRARAVRAAEPMAKPLPMAAVVLPRASRPSVIFRTSGPSSAISEIPPALSATGP